jgi:tetratricopeptide (TPR) repeat protein
MMLMQRWCAIFCIFAPWAWAADPAVATAQATLDAGDYARAADRAEQSAAAFHSRHDAAGEAFALNIAGSAHLHRGEYDLALARYQSALALDRRQHDSAGQVTRLTNIGSVYFFRGRYLEALAEYQTALRLGGGDQQLVFTNLATLYDQLGDNAKALDYYQQALAFAPTAALLTSLGTLYRRMGDPAKALESYHAAMAWEEIGVTQAVDLHDLESALKSFDKAVALASPNDLALAHLYRGEARYRLNRPGADDDFRAAGDNWLALYRLGEVSQALALRDAPLPTGFFPPKSELYDAAIAHGGARDRERLYSILERANGCPGEPAPLAAVRSRLASGSLLMESWTTRDRIRVLLWITRDGAEVTKPDGQVLPRGSFTQFLIVGDGRPPVAGPVAVSYLPYASLLVRDEPWRTPLMPWQGRRLTVAAKHDLYRTEAPILIFNSRATADSGDPNRSRLDLSPAESLYCGEIKSLPLAKTDLVILPAPDPSGVFSRAFIAAGARTVLAGAPPEFQRRFLPLIEGGENKAAAVRDAQRAFPQYSGIILTGDGQQPTREAIFWQWPVIAAAFLTAGLVTWWRRR